MLSKYHYYYINFILKLIKYPFILAILFNLIIVLISNNIALCSIHTTSEIINITYNTDGSYTVETINHEDYTVYPKTLIDSMANGSHQVIFKEPVIYTEVINQDIYIFHTPQKPCSCCVDTINMPRKQISVPHTIDPFSVISTTSPKAFPNIAGIVQFDVSEEEEESITAIQMGLLSDHYVNPLVNKASFLIDRYVLIAKQEAINNTTYQSLKIAIYYAIKTDCYTPFWVYNKQNEVSSIFHISTHLLEKIPYLISNTPSSDLTRIQYLSHLGACMVALNNANIMHMPEGTCIFNASLYDPLYQGFYNLRQK